MKALISSFCVLLIMLGGLDLAFGGSQATSSLTAATIETRARRDLDEDTAQYWNQDDMIQWIDEAVREIVYTTKCLESGTSLIVIKDSVFTYDITGNWLTVETVTYDSGVTDDRDYLFTLKRINLRSLGHSKETGNPKYFAVWNDDLIIEPVPGADQSGTTLYLYRTDLPSGVTLITSPIETPTYFDTAILDYVKAKALYKDSKEVRGDYHMSRFKSRIASWMIHMLPGGLSLTEED